MVDRGIHISLGRHLRGIPCHQDPEISYSLIDPGFYTMGGAHLEPGGNDEGGGP